jgi:DNA repair protein RadA/Sms
MVDVVVYFDSNSQNNYRFIRSTKNRFGSIDEIMLFEMEKEGLKLIDNPSLYFIDNDLENSSIGKCKSVIIEGERPLIIEIEALVVPSYLGAPRRSSEGIDLNRVNKIVAILMKHIGENLNNYDIYINVSGGIRTKDLGIDLAIASSIYSSKNQKALKNNTVFIGELSLTGRIRNVIKLDKRIKEAIKFGINNLFIPNNSDILKGEDNKNIDLIKIDTIIDGVRRLSLEKNH